MRWIDWMKSMEVELSSANRLILSIQQILLSCQVFSVLSVPPWCGLREAKRDDPRHLLRRYS
jgi:hypothetical protein